MGKNMLLIKMFLLCLDKHLLALNTVTISQTRGNRTKDKTKPTKNRTERQKDSLYINLGTACF